MTTKPKFTCTICRHEKRPKIELDCAAGAAMRAVARRHAVSYHALRRHWGNHVAPERRAELIAGPLKQKELHDRADGAAVSAVDAKEIVLDTALRKFRACDELNDILGVRSMGYLALSAAQELQKSAGALPSRVVNIQNNFFHDPGIIELGLFLNAELADVPEKRRRVMSWLRARMGGAAASPAFPAPEMIDAAAA